MPIPPLGEEEVPDRETAAPEDCAPGSGLEDGRIVVW